MALLRVYLRPITDRIGIADAVQGEFQPHAGQKPYTLTRMMGISALSFAGMKKNARTTTRAAITICAQSLGSARRWHAFYGQVGHPHLHILAQQEGNRVRTQQHCSCNMPRTSRRDVAPSHLAAHEPVPCKCSAEAVTLFDEPQEGD